MASLATAQLLFLESEDPGRPINLYINRWAIDTGQHFLLEAATVVQLCRAHIAGCTYCSWLCVLCRLLRALAGGYPAFA